MSLVDELRDTPCNREPFTSEHRGCQCRKANAAADRIEGLEGALKVIASGFQGNKILADHELSAIAYKALDVVSQPVNT